MRIAATAALIGVAALLSGCGTLGRAECEIGDWRTIGIADGANGQPASRIGRHAEACASFGVGVNLDEYTAGREIGLREYCRPARGFQAGRAGERYFGVCPADKATAFEAAYEDGRRVYEANREVRDIESDIASAERRLERLDDEAAEAERVAVDSADANARAAAISDLRRVTEERGRIRSDLVELGVRLGRAEAAAEAVERELLLRY